MAVSALVGVYAADGGLLGEAAYVWDRMAATLPVPIRLLHLNELDEEIRAVVAAARAPVVQGRVEVGWQRLIGATELDAMAGSVSVLDDVLRRRLQAPPTAGIG